MHKALDFSEKISLIREHFNLSQDKLAARLGVSGSAIGFLQSGRTKKPSAELLSSFTTVLGINPHWLLTGQGEMLLSDAHPQKKLSYTEAGELLSPPNTSNATRLPIDGLNLRVLPYVPFEARAGVAEFYLDDLTKYPWERAETLAVIDVPDTAEYKNAIVIGIAGDSMEPTIKSGSKVVVTPVQRGNWEYLNSGIYCIIYLNNFVVKRVKDNTLMESGILRLYSDNPAGGSFPIKGEDIRAVWRVRWAAYTPLE